MLKPRCPTAMVMHALLLAIHFERWIKTASSCPFLPDICALWNNFSLGSLINMFFWEILKLELVQCHWETFVFQMNFRRFSEGDRGSFLIQKIIVDFLYFIRIFWL